MLYGHDKSAAKRDFCYREDLHGHRLFRGLRHSGLFSSKPGHWRDIPRRQPILFDDVEEMAAGGYASKAACRGGGYAGREGIVEHDDRRRDLDLLNGGGGWQGIQPQLRDQTQ